MDVRRKTEVRFPRLGIPGLLRSRRGSQMVEATIVIPLLILTILSMILLLIFFYEGAASQCRVQKKLIREARKDVMGIKIVKKDASHSRKMQGLISLRMKKNYAGRCYKLDQTELIRIGDEAKTIVGKFTSIDGEASSQNGSGREDSSRKASGTSKSDPSASKTSGSAASKTSGGSSKHRRRSK